MDYTQLAADELIDRAYSARDEFNTLYGSNDTSDGTLDRMASLVDELEALQTEADSRVALAVKREALAMKVANLKPGYKVDMAKAGKDKGKGKGYKPAFPGAAPPFADAKKVDDDSPQEAGADLAAAKEALRVHVEELAGKIPPAFLKNIEKVKAAAAAKKAMGSKVTAQLDAPYSQDLTPARAKDIKVTKAVEPENKETTDIEKKAASSKASLALNPDVAPIKGMPSKGFGAPLPKKDTLPTDLKGKHPGASVIKPGTVKGLKVPTPASPVTYSESDPIEFADGPATKSEGAAGNFPASDYAYVPDAEKSSTWKLRLTATPGGDPDPGIVGAAAAALSPGGFRGQKVQIPSSDLPKVKAKVAAAWKKANSDKDFQKEAPDSLK